MSYCSSHLASRKGNVKVGYMTSTQYCQFLVQPKVILLLVEDIDFETNFHIDYVKQVFVKEIDLQYRRKIPGDEFVDNFASDRSHMIREGTDNYLSPPPEYPPMTGALAPEKGVKMNLMSSFVCMENNVETFGEVLDVGEMEKVAVTS
ncbi:hypothetical protein APHAL10511_007066 [Amanita phalloides]|nr:hypothetical protein APHAL10511_007066 [Amanita phalloides]